MFLATINKRRQLLFLSYVQKVTVKELEQGKDDIVALLQDLDRGFCLLTDLSQLESMDVDCAAVIGQVMELCDQKQVGMVVRVVPDRSKDIGLDILSLFHYSRRPRTATCKSLVEAMRTLNKHRPDEAAA